MKLGLGSQGGVVDVACLHTAAADVQRCVHNTSEASALVRVATTLTKDFRHLYTRHHFSLFLTLLMRYPVARRTKEGRVGRKRFSDFRDSSIRIFGIFRDGEMRMVKKNRRNKARAITDITE